MRTLYRKNDRKNGFTIVELLIVIVVIAILAAITIVGYSYVVKNAADASLKSDLNKVTDSLDAENFDTGYPSSLSAINGGRGPTVADGTVLQYTGTATSYCVTAFSQRASGSFYRMSGGGSVQAGTCPGHYNPFLPAPVLTWATISPSNSNNRNGVASSVDGTKVVMGDAQYSPGYISVSTNSGATWALNDVGSGAGGGSFGPVKMSADGSVIGVYNGYTSKLYVSTNSGVTWTQRSSTPPQAIGLTFAMSSDGQKMAIGTSVGYLYTSYDAGVTWTARTAPNIGWVSMVMSDDATRYAATASNGYVYTSSDSAATWAQQSATAGFNLKAMDASSTMGTIIGSAGASGTSGFIYTSTDYGTTWTKQTTLGTGYWSGVGVSDSGATMLVGADNFAGTVQLSTNTGNTWTKQTSFGTYPMARTIAVSGDGHTLYIAGGSGGVSYKASL